MTQIYYDKLLTSFLKYNTLFRHLINKAKSKCKVIIELHNGVTIEGVLKSVDLYFKFIEIHTPEEELYINLRYVKTIKIAK